MTASDTKRLALGAGLALLHFLTPVQAQNLDRGLDLKVGEALFERLWVQAPASTTSSDGLGPLFSARSCAACHPRQGRAQSDRVITRLTPRDPTYGDQIQTHAIAGLPAEARLDVTYQVTQVTLPDGRSTPLRRPQITLHGLSHAPLAETTATGLRVAPRTIGMAALDGIPDSAILANADPNDHNGDGIAGRVSRTASGQIGRFGWNATHPSLRAQITSAFHIDLGLGTPDHPAPWGDCTDAQTACRTAPHGGLPEVSDQLLILVERFLRNQEARPAPPPPDSFHTAQCSACHLPELGGVRALTDLLLHDMGQDLADQNAGVTLWRTPPLWGAGLTGGATKRTTYLHDGRARSVTEAILWHGGEAARAKELFMALPSPDRAALVTYLENL